MENFTITWNPDTQSVISYFYVYYRNIEPSGNVGPWEKKRVDQLGNTTLASVIFDGDQAGRNYDVYMTAVADSPTSAPAESGDSNTIRLTLSKHSFPAN